MANPRLAIIGCGRIANFHAPAFREAGFDLAVVCSRPESTRLRPFAEAHEIPLVFDSVEQLLKARVEWDALLIAASVDATPEILTAALDSEAPILVEKPVSRNPSDLLPLINRQLPVIVGYNRRFYRTVQEARREVDRGHPLLAHLAIPESVRTPDRLQDNPDYLKNSFGNSVHGLDLARYVFGPLRVEHVRRITNPSGAILGLAATLIAEGGSVVQFMANWGAPANFSLTLDRPGHRLDLRPFEVGTVYEGMEIREPTPQTPIRTYWPKQVGTLDLGEADRQFKPGFVAQAKALAALVRGEDSAPAARLEDAHAVLELAQELVTARYGL